MKIEFDDLDNFIIGEAKAPRFFSSEGNYSFNVRINDVDKANYFFSELMYNLREDLSEKAGMEITSINLYTAIPTDEIENQLKAIIDGIYYERNRLSVSPYTDRKKKQTEKSEDVDVDPCEPCVKDKVCEKCTYGFRSVYERIALYKLNETKS